nr:MAG TPA: hypothetical protein [Caudoviricetes sp.]
MTYNIVASFIKAKCSVFIIYPSNFRRQFFKS